MKLIIDIDENLYKVVQNEVKGKVNISNVWTAIANGMPYEEIPQGEWIPIRERLPEEETDPHTNDFKIVLCTTIWEDVRPYKFGKAVGHEKSHFWHIGAIMDKYVIAWQPIPEPYKGGEEE